MHRLACLASLCLWLQAPVAQKPAEPRSLASLTAAFAAQRDALYAGESMPSREKEQDLLMRQLTELEAFAEHEASGDDRWAARLLVAERALQVRAKERVAKAVASLLADGVPGLARMDAAVFALQLGDTATKDALVARALRETSEVEARIQLARVLMTSLRDVAKGEEVVAEALAAAADDEARAAVRWYACEALREREDLPENSYYEALEKLAKELPDTRWGSVARDRVAASQFAVGTKVFDFALDTVGGRKVAAREFTGKAVALVFASFDDEHTKGLLAALLERKKRSGDKLAVALIAADPTPAAVEAAGKTLGESTPICCSGKGLRGDLFLRFHVETVPTVVLLDRTGAIAGLALHVETRDARAEFDEAFARALAPAK